MFIIDVLIKFKVTPKLYSLTIETIMNFKNKIKQLVYKNI
jgi:hypothetical protein